MVNPRVIREAANDIAFRERGPSSDGVPQWMLWAFDAHGRGKFKRTLQICKQIKALEAQGLLEPGSSATLLDALAGTRLNVTPDRLQWTFEYAPEKVRQSLLNTCDYNGDLGRFIEYMVVGSTPMNPSEGKAYNDLWVGFNPSAYPREEWFKWLD